MSARRYFRIQKRIVEGLLILINYFIRTITYIYINNMMLSYQVIIIKHIEGGITDGGAFKRHV